MHQETDRCVRNFQAIVKEIRILSQDIGTLPGNGHCPEKWGLRRWERQVWELIGNKGCTLRKKWIRNDPSPPAKSNCQITAEQGQNGGNFLHPTFTLPRQPKHPPIVKLAKAVLDRWCPKILRKRAQTFPVLMAWASCKVNQPQPEPAGTSEQTPRDNRYWNHETQITGQQTPLTIF